MNVAQAIKILNTLPANAPLHHLWDGALRTEIEHIYLGKTGKVVTADWGENSYEDDGRPVDAPSSEEDRYWCTPELTIESVERKTLKEKWLEFLRRL